MEMDCEVMRMRKLHQGIDLKAPLTAEQSFPLKLKFENAGEINVEVQIQASGAASEHQH